MATRPSRRGKPGAGGSWRPWPGTCGSAGAGEPCPTGSRRGGRSTAGSGVGWDNASTHEDEEVEAVLRGAAGRLVLLHLPTYSPWLNPIEMLWRHFCREVTHCELFESIDAVLEATREFFDRYNRAPQRTRAIIGAHPA